MIDRLRNAVQNDDAETVRSIAVHCKSTISLEADRMAGNFEIKRDSFSEINNNITESVRRIMLGAENGECQNKMVAVGRLGNFTNAMDKQKPSDDTHAHEVFENCLEFPVIGQGTFFFTCKKRKTFSVLVSTEKYSQQESQKTIPDKYIALRVSSNYAKFTMKANDIEEEEFLLRETAKHTTNSKLKNKGIKDPEVTDTYWYSYDSVGQVVKYGRGYTMESTTLMIYNNQDDYPTEILDKDKQNEVTETFFNPHKPLFLWVYSSSSEQTATAPTEVECKFKLQAEAFVSDFPPLVKDSSKVTLFDLDRSEYMFSSSLPAACQELYANMKGLKLEEPADPIMKLSDAIRYSINSKGCVLYEKLEKKRKMAKFGPVNQAMTYLRVTLGPDQKRGPGVPYVLEIWPSGHCSPIHGHGGSCAIIKVLFGRLTVKIFNKMSNPQASDPEIVKMFDCKEGDITWISPDWYQTHQLENRTDDFCATIQGYRYAQEDKIRFPGFEYIPDTEKENIPLELFIPNSDFTFVSLRFKVLEEYRKYLLES